MKRLALLVSCSAMILSGADLATVRNVYLLKMSKGLDQHLANRLTGEHVFQVVTDPKLADAVLTDHIGEDFQAKLDELYPPPESEKPEKPAKPEDDEESGARTLLPEPVNKVSNPAANSSFGRARGTIFLVDLKTKQVLWSAYEVPKDASSKELDRTALDFVSRIKRDLNPKK
jgi:hypothetical protein